MFAEWATRVMAARRAGHSAQTLGILTDEVVEFVRAHGREIARLLVMNEKTLAHAISPRKQAEGITLKPEDIRRLPSLIADAVYYWDNLHDNLLLAMALSDSETALVPVNPARKLRKLKSRLDEVVNAFKVSDRRLHTDRKRFEPMGKENGP